MCAQKTGMVRLQSDGHQSSIRIHTPITRISIRRMGWLLASPSPFAHVHASPWWSKPKIRGYRWTENQENCLYLKHGTKNWWTKSGFRCKRQICCSLPWCLLSFAVEQKPDVSIIWVCLNIGYNYHQPCCFYEFDSNSMRIEDRFGDEVLFLPSKIQLQCWLCKSESKHSHRKVVLLELRVNEL